MKETLLSISEKALLPEADAVSLLLDSLSSFDTIQTRVHARARKLVEAIRTHHRPSPLEAFLQEYGLDTLEGVALMRLSEALLRIPDEATAEALLKETLHGANWQKHHGASDSLLVNASSMGLKFAEKLVNNPYGMAFVYRVMQKALKLMGGHFVMGETIEQACKNARRYPDYLFSFDMLGEGARMMAQADAYFAAYVHAINTIPEGGSISIKLSALHPRYQLVKQERLMRELLPRLKPLVLQAAKRNIMVSIDAEEANRLDINLILFTTLYQDKELAGYDKLGYVLQAYQKRAWYVIDYLAELAKQAGKSMPIRLVKGAYWDSEIKHAQVMGFAGYPVFTRKEHTDISYLACAQKILEQDVFYPQFATHNAYTVSAILEMTEARNIKDFEFQRLQGMGESLYAELVKQYKVRVYAPVGKHEDLLAYLIRRLLENGANNSFVHGLMNKKIPIETLISSPVERAKTSLPSLLPLPANLYGVARKNSHGIDLGYLAQQPALPPPPKTNMLDYSPLLAMEAAQNAFPAWQKKSADERAIILERIADLLEDNRDALCALIIEEAYKTLPDAIAEVREAADFCRYYAAEARKKLQPKNLQGPTGEENTLHLEGRGVFVAISPWNFPLAIFMGQIAAALVCGNSVVAKPAPQTPRIANFALSLMQKAGLPVDVVQLVQGGAQTGETLITHPATAGVVFTGSTATAHHIAKSLAAKKGAIIPFIAETGGQNCMIVDSSALLEQVVDDVILSAFGSAGQRCSALRVLYVQEEIADKLSALLEGAMAELNIGNAAELATDIPPVIDSYAQTKLLDHIERMHAQAKFIAKSECPDDGFASFVAPYAFEIPSISFLEEEIFGPILHVIRFRLKDLPKIIEEINSTGYGLTFGLHTRLQSRIMQITPLIHAGNIYINRSMTGAVVGVQPFGGQGLSGTGFKAGGEHYLLRFCHERTVTTNTTAIGGNLGLLI